MIVKSIVWPDESATQAFATALARQPALAHAQIQLLGYLGSGKTTFVRYLLTALGVQGRIKSPTYTVVEPYELANDSSHPALHPACIWHFDFYRFNDPNEWEEAGFRDIFASPGLKLVEWPDKAGKYLPPAYLRLAIAVDANDARHVTLTALSDTGAKLLP